MRLRKNWWKKSQKIQSSKNAQNRSRVSKRFSEQFFRKKNCPVFHGGSSLRIFSKKIKTFSNFQTCQKIVSKMCKRVLNMLWGNIFENSFAQCSLQGISDSLDWKLWVQILEIKKYEFSFPDLKAWVQFSDTKLNRHSFCIHATVKLRNSISDFLDLKLWVQILEIKNMSSVLRT